MRRWLVGLLIVGLLGGLVAVAAIAALLVPAGRIADIAVVHPGN